MKKILLALVANSFYLLFPSQSFTQNKESYQPPFFEDADRIKKMEASFSVAEKMYRDFAEKNHFPGYSFALVADGRIIFSGSGGYADIYKKIPATIHSMFRIASMSKSFTAMAILKLRDEGKLKLDDPLYLYIPEIKNQQLTADAPAITIRNLMSHAAGYPEDNPWGDRQLARTEDELIQLYEKGISFSNDPGLQFEYSNLGFATLGYVIHKVSGIPYEEYIAKNIWQPLGIQAYWEYAKIPPDQLAHGYRWLNEKWNEETLLHDGIYGAMGGMITSVESFSKYVAFHLSAWPPRNDEETGPVKRSSVREMHQPWRFTNIFPNVKLPDGEACPIAVGYGYGLGFTKDCKGRTMIAHSGGLPGFGSNWRILPDYGIGIILFANVTYASTSGINLQVLDTVIKLANLQPRKLPPSSILTQRRNEIVKLLPDFSEAKNAGIFAENFFLDYFTDSLKKEAHSIFDKAGKIVKVNDVVPENQLRGYFIIECEKAGVQITFTLTPETPALVQEYHIKLLTN